MFKKLGPRPTHTSIVQAVTYQGKSDKGTWPNAHRPFPTLTFHSSALLWKSPSVLVSRCSQAAMSVPEASETPSFRPTVRDLITGPASVPLPQPDDLEAILDAEIATHATILTMIEDCKRQLEEISASLSPQDPTIRDLRHTFSHALLEASRSMDRQSILRKQLRIISGHQRSDLGLAIDRLLEMRDESLRMEFVASAQVYDSVASAARIMVRPVISLCKGMFGQGARVGRAWSKMWEQLRATLVDKDKEDKEDLEAGEEGGKEKPKGEEEEGDNEE